MDVQLHSFLTSVIDGGDWSDSLPDRSTPGKEPGVLNRRLDVPTAPVPAFGIREISVAPTSI